MTEKDIELLYDLASIVLGIGLVCIIIVEPLLWNGTLPDIYKVVMFLSAIWLLTDLWIRYHN